MKPAAADDSDEPLTIGSIVDGKYRIEGSVGQGGMGTVYRAHHLTLNEPVAIKVLRPQAAADDEMRARFLREAQWAVKLRSEHVARVHDVGTTDRDLPFMVMELLEGADLGDLVDQNGPMHAPIAVDLLLQACDAIVEAHALGIVHRDLKPTNLFVSFRPDDTALVKVLDFGISKASSGTDLSLTQTQSMLGTPAYMSPEQMRSARDVDQRTDIWSLGCVLYELVEGRRPFAAESFSEMCVMVAVDPPHPMSAAPQLQAVVGRCLEKQPDARYATVADLMADLVAFAHNADAARFYVTRAQRVSGRDSQPVLPRTPPRGVALSGSPTPPAMPIAALTMYQPNAKPIQYATTRGQVSPPLRARRSRAAWIGALLAIVVGVSGAFAYSAMSDDPTPTREPVAAEPVAAEPVITPAIAEPTPARPAAAEPVAAEPVAAEPVAAEPVAAEPEPASKPVKKPGVRRPLVKKPVVAAPAPAPPPTPAAPPKKKCDPFDSRVRC